MTPQQQQLENDLPETPLIQGIQGEVEGLKEGQERIIHTIEEEKEQNRRAFDKGAEKFDDLYNKVEEMKGQIKDGFDSVKKEIADHTLQGKEDEIKKLNKRLDARDQIKNGVIITLVGGILLAGAIYLLKIVLSAPIPTP